MRRKLETSAWWWIVRLGLGRRSVYRYHRKHALSCRHSHGLHVNSALLQPAADVQSEWVVVWLDVRKQQQWRACGHKLLSICEHKEALSQSHVHPSGSRTKTRDRGTVRQQDRESQLQAP